MTKKILLNIKNLSVTIKTKQILNNLNLKIKEQEIHIIMGPNGSGKSTLAKTLVGHPVYTNIKGQVSFNNQNLIQMLPNKRALEGLFLAFQNPIEISGISNYDFLYLAHNQKQNYLKQPSNTPLEFLNIITPLIQTLKLNSDFLHRNINEGFSGGEKKKNEILQILLLKPKLIILDEIDSGLDIDAIKSVTTELNNISRNASLLIITHNIKILKYIQPTYLHILKEGNIIKTGTKKLSKQLEKTGYQLF
jgi:Fe-S cluster assembly ATP-binding protein